MGRAGFKFTSEHLALIGKIPDAQLARKAGCSLTAVRNKRSRLGIPNHLRRPKGSKVAKAAKEIKEKNGFNDY